MTKSESGEERGTESAGDPSYGGIVGGLGRQLVWQGLNSGFKLAGD